MKYVVQERTYIFRFHLLAFNATTRALFKGFGYALPLCVSFPPKPDELVRNVESKNGITVLATVPSLLEQVIRELLSEKYRHIGLEPLKRLRFITYGGSGCPDDLCRILVDNGIVLSSIYGSTGLLRKRSNFSCGIHFIVDTRNGDFDDKKVITI